MTPARPPAEKRAAAADRPDPTLKAKWARLHRGDREPFPETSAIAFLAEGHAPLGTWIADHGGAERLARQLQAAWSAFHAGEFPEAIALGSKLGALGAPVASKSAAVYSLYPGSHERDIPRLLERAATRGEAAVRALPDYANVHYTLALVLGRYSQRISILRALTEGLAGRVHAHLNRTLELEPQHAEAHIALGLYHAEIVAQLGALAARLTYGVSSEAAIDHFERAVELTPDSPIALMEYAHALLRLDARAHRERARELYRRAAACHGIDTMERLDRDRARRELGSL